NPHLYAHKAKRKKIALISVEVANETAVEIQIELQTAKLHVRGQAYNVESPGVILRKFSEFTWDFVLYSILAFHPVLAFVDAFFFLTGPLYNRRLRKQLQLLSDHEMILGPGESKKVLLGFMGVAKAPTQLRIAYGCDGGEKQEIVCDIHG